MDWLWKSGWPPTRSSLTTTTARCVCLPSLRYYARRWSGCTTVTWNSSSVMHLYWTNRATFSSRDEKTAVGCKMSSSVSRLWFALAESVSLTSTDTAAAWSQASIPPPLLPVAEDREGVDPSSDSFPPAVANGAVALLHGSTTHNFNDKSSSADNIDITADRRLHHHHHQLSLRLLWLQRHQHLYLRLQWRRRHHQQHHQLYLELVWRRHHRLHHHQLYLRLRWRWRKDVVNQCLEFAFPPHVQAVSPSCLDNPKRVKTDTRSLLLTNFTKSTCGCVFDFDI